MSALSLFASLLNAITPPTCPCLTRWVRAGSGPCAPSLATIDCPIRRFSPIVCSLPPPPPLEISTISPTITSTASAPTITSWRRRTRAGRSRRLERRPRGGLRPLRSNSPVSSRSRRRSAIPSRIAWNEPVSRPTARRSPVPGTSSPVEGSGRSRAGESVHSKSSSPPGGPLRSIRLALSAPASHGDPKFAQLPLVDRRRRARQRIGPGGGLREGDHVADRLCPVQQRDHPVQPVGDAAVRRGAVAERLEQKAEAVLGLLLVDSDRLEHLSLHPGVVDADRTSSNLPSVPDDVIGLCPRGAGIAGFELAVGRGERVILGVPALLGDVPAEQWPVHHPRQLVRFAVDQAESLAQTPPKLAEDLRREQRLVRHDEQDVTLARGQRLIRLGDLFGREELRNRRAPAIELHHRPDESLRAQVRRLSDETVQIRARHLARARIQAADDGAALDRLPEGVELRVAEDIGELVELEAEAKIGLVGAVAVDRLVIGNLPHRQRDLDATPPQHERQQPLVQIDHVPGIDEGHLDVQLREVGLPVGAQVLVPEAAGDLEIPLEPTDHEELLEELRRLRQRVERSGMQ